MCCVLFAPLIIIFFFQYLFKSRFVKEMFSASTNTGNYKIAVIPEIGVYALCLQNTDYLKDTKDG